MQFQMRNHFDDGGDKDSLLTVLFKNICLVVDVDLGWLCSQFSKQLTMMWTQYYSLLHSCALRKQKPGNV